MEFIKLNINSTKPFYTCKLGKIYNQNYKELKCSNVNDSLFLPYVLNDSEKTFCKHSVARLIYQTYFPNQNLSKYNIYRKELDIENPYQIGNLKKVKKLDMPKQNKLPQMHKSGKIKLKFYEKLSASQFNILVSLAKNPDVKSTTLAGLYNVCDNAIYNHRKFLSNQKLKKNMSAKFKIELEDGKQAVEITGHPLDLLLDMTVFLMKQEQIAFIIETAVKMREIAIKDGGKFTAERLVKGDFKEGTELMANFMKRYDNRNI